jgi:hypothetical protein
MLRDCKEPEHLASGGESLLEHASGRTLRLRDPTNAELRDIPALPESDSIQE